MKKIIIVFISLVLLAFFFILFPVARNNKYTNNLEKEVTDNYEIKEKINYLNKSNLYYIILTTKNLIVLDKNYKEILKEDIKKIKILDKDYELVYRLNNVMYETKEISKDKITYNYYDIYTNELIDTLVVGG